MKTEHRSPKVLILALAAAATLLAGCSGSPPWGGWSKQPSPTQVQSALGGPRSETYIYFARYEVYRQIHSKEYVYQDQGRWVHRDQPPANTPEAVLQKSPTVEVTFSGTPEEEHQTVRRTHPPDPVTGPAIVAAVH